MDLSNVDINVLTKQLRKPEGEFGEEVGRAMAQYNAPAYAFVFECLRVQPEDHVLEIGFGPGEGIAEAVRLTPKGFVAGIDHSETMLAAAEKRNHRAVMQERVELTLGSATELPYKDGSFDKIFAVNVFHFWPDPTRELSECARVLKPGGQIVLYVVHPASWLKGFAESGVFVAREPEESDNIFAAAGFTKVEHRMQTFEGGKGFVVMGGT
jgi:SAM-dependent methyltransferase